MPGVGEQFAGLDMENLIGAPLTAAANASVLLAQSAADFIQRVGFDKQEKVRTVQFKFNRQSTMDDGNIGVDEMAVDVPLLAIVPIPNLQIDEVNILFDMEVKQSERSEKSLDMGATLEASAKIGPFSVSVKGSVASHESNTRSSDNSAKYHVDIRATNHGIPEGLARVLDMMAANVAPNLVSSKATDAYGKELSGASKERNNKLKLLRERGMQLSNAETSANDNFELKLKNLKAKGKTLRDRVLSTCLKDINGTDEKIADEAKKKMDQSETFWDSFNAAIKSTIEREASNATPLLANSYPAVTAIEFDPVNLKAEFDDAVKAYNSLKVATKAVEDNKADYNTTMIAPIPQTTGQQSQSGT
jgi:hypothetical protein